MVEEIFYGRPSTIKCQRSLFKNWIAPHLPNDESGLDNHYLLKMIKLWQESGLKPGTVRLLAAILKKFVYATTGREIKAPRLSRSLQNYNKEPVKAWAKTQVKLALEAAKETNPDLYDLIVVGLYTGCRPGEIFSLRGKDINLLRGTISIVNTKTGKPRTIRMALELQNIIIKYIKPGKENDYLFKGKVPNDELRALCKFAKIPSITFHGLRHTHATLALESGHSPRDVARQLGHNRVSTCLDYYWQALNDSLEVDWYD